MRTTEVQTTDEMESRITQLAKRKYDVIEYTKNAFMLNDGETVRVRSTLGLLPDVQEGRMSNLALSQFGSWSNMGSMYPTRLRAEIDHAKDIEGSFEDESTIKYWKNEGNEHRRILASNVNHWFKHRDTERMFRFYKSDDLSSKPAELRSFNSPSYRRVDNNLIWDSVSPVIRKLVEEAGLEVGSLFVDETGMHGKFLLPKLQGEIALNNVVRGGFRVRNSEVGESRYLIEPFVMVLACLNGMVICKYQGGIRGIHRGKRQEAGVLDQYGNDSIATNIDYKRFQKLVRETIAKCVSEETFDAFLDQARVARNGEKISNHSNISEAKPWLPSVDIIGEDFQLGRSDRASIDESLVRSGDFSKWGMSQAITQPANNQDISYARSSRLEEIGGQVLSMNNDQWHRIVTHEAPRLAA